MARTGVSYLEIAEAATQLMELGRNPTVEQVRLLLGTGSSTTISNHLRQWKSNQESTSLISIKENLPPELIAVMKGLWERVINHSQEQVTSIEAGYQQTISELEQEVEKYRTNNHRWQKMYDQWIAEKNQFANDKLTLEQALEFSHKGNTSLHAKQDVLLQQLQDREVRIEELHRLHKQAQENLEYYRESAREQRLLDQQQFEQQNQQLQFEIKNLNEQLVMHREKTTVLQQQFQTLHQSHMIIQKDFEIRQVQLETVKASLAEAEKEKNEHLNSSQYWQNQYKESQNMLNEKSTQFAKNKVETDVLIRELTNNKQSLECSLDQIKLLSHEKWVLEKEKSQLEGQLKQMQKMINV